MRLGVGHRGRTSAVVVLVSIVGACTPTVSPDPEFQVIEPQVTAPTTAITIEPPTPTSTPSLGVYPVERIDEIPGTAPLILVSGRVPQVDVRYGIDYRDSNFVPPSELDFKLIRCTTPGPGVVSFEVELIGESVAYPLDVYAASSVKGTSFGGGGGAWGVATAEQVGNQIITFSKRAFTAALPGLRRELGRVTYAGRASNWAFSGASCSFDFEPAPYRITSRIEDTPGRIELTAPTGTVERLGQEAFNEGYRAALFPLATAYGEGTRFFASRWFLPANPAKLIEVAEQLKADGCLELEFVYKDYTITQFKDCDLQGLDSLYRRGSSWFAFTGDGEWEVLVEAQSKETVLEVGSSLRAYWHLNNRPQPLAPNSEVEIGRAPFQGGEVLITLGEARCREECEDTEQWFYLYTIHDEQLEQLADYPGGTGCMLEREARFQLGVAPPGGSVVVTENGLSVTIDTGITHRPFVFREDIGQGLLIEIFDSPEETPECVSLLASD